MMMNTGKGNQGYAKYLSRVIKAKQMKEETNIKASVVFRTGSKWRPGITEALNPNQGFLEKAPRSLKKPCSPEKSYTSRREI